MTLLPQNNNDVSRLSLVVTDDSYLKLRVSESISLFHAVSLELAQPKIKKVRATSKVKQSRLTLPELKSKHKSKNRLTIPKGINSGKLSNKGQGTIPDMLAMMKMAANLYPDGPEKDKAIKEIAEMEKLWQG